MAQQSPRLSRIGADRALPGAMGPGIRLHPGARAAGARLECANAGGCARARECAAAGVRRSDMAAPTPAPAIGCLAMFGATALAALLVTLGISPPLTGTIYIPVFVVTAIIAGLVGSPLYLLARRHRR